MDRRAFLASLGLGGVGLLLPPAEGSLRWSHARAHPGMALRLDELHPPPDAAWLVVRAEAADRPPRELARLPLAARDALAGWRVPPLEAPTRGVRRWRLEAHVEDAVGRPLARTDAPLEMHVRRLWFSA